MMSPQAIKVTHGRFHVFKPSDDSSWVWFPYSALRRYQASEVAAGRPPIFITATYAGKTRPVLWSWSLKLQNGVPTTNSSEWEYAVNVQDDRFIKFWINNYVRGILWKNLTNLQNLWVGLDECAFTPDLYGVLDDTNHFVSGVKWDFPFPQDEGQYLDSINKFFVRVKQLAPDLKLMPNTGSMKTWSRFPYAYQSASGVMVEEVYTPSTSVFVRNKLFSQYTAYSWASAQAKVMILRSEVPAADPVKIRSSLVAYMLLKGPNTFYAPRIAGTILALPPTAYTQMLAAIGSPVSDLQSQQQPGTTSPGFRLYWRECEGGRVYLNWTGKAQTIRLSGRQYYDTNGKAITEITIPDLTGDYVRFNNGGDRSEVPRINPRLSSPATSPLTVTITDPSGNGVIYYTLNGTIPYKTSPVYNGPLTLSSDKIVMARVSLISMWTSFTSQADYTVTSALPQVGFAIASDSGPAGIYYAGAYYPVVALSSVAPSIVTVQYTARPLGKTPVQGTVTFKPGDLYRYFPIGASVRTTVTLSGPQGAVFGTTTVFEYTPQ
jgi:hypothetical protein